MRRTIAAVILAALACSSAGCAGLTTVRVSGWGVNLEVIVDARKGDENRPANADQPPAGEEPKP